MEQVLHVADTRDLAHLAFDVPDLLRIVELSAQDNDPAVRIDADLSLGNYESYQRELHDRVAHADSDPAAVFAPGFISTARELALLPAPRLHETKIRAKLAHYRASLRTLRRAFEEVALVDLLDSELNPLVAPAATATHNDGAITTTEHAKRSKHRSHQSKSSTGTTPSKPPSLKTNTTLVRHICASCALATEPEPPRTPSAPLV